MKRTIFSLWLFLYPQLIFASPKIIITEIGACEPGNAEWIEVWNVSEEPVDLTKWKFLEQGTNHSINQSDDENTLLPNVRAIIVDKEEEFLTIFPNFSGQVFDSSWSSLKNSGEEIALRDENDDIELGEQFTYPSCESGKSLERISARADPSLLESWQLSTEHGTPGENSGQAGEEISEQEEKEEDIQFKSGDATVRITEIQPHKIENMEEWFEFEIEGNEAIDISDWQISNGTSSTIKFLDSKNDLILASGAVNLAGREVELTESGTVISEEISGLGTTVILDENRLIFLPQETARFFWTKSPISLPNDNGTIQILNENNETKAEINYEKAKSGTSLAVEWSEIWNAHKEKNSLFPLIYKNNKDSNFRHTQGEENFDAPTYPEDIELLISEISPNRDSETGPDFIELYIKSANTNPINLKYLEIKHNGTSLININYDFRVREGDFLVIKPDQETSDIINSASPYEIHSLKEGGISSGSGTVEVILFSGTSFETTEDFICWKKTELSATEASRVEKNREADNWTEPCIDIEGIIKNESIARFVNYEDHNMPSDFFRHFNGSLGKINETVNSPPTAVIKIQGSGKISGAIPFSLNVTGEGSTDPNGNYDLQLFEWKLNNKVFSNVMNPPNQKLNNPDRYTLTLTVTDFSGQTDSEEITIETYASGGASTHIDRPLKSWLEKILIKKVPKARALDLTLETKNNTSPQFFQHFIDRVNPEFLQKIEEKKRKEAAFIPYPQYEAVEKPSSPPEKKQKIIVSQRKIQLSPKMRKKVAKNISFIFQE